MSNFTSIKSSLKKTRVKSILASVICTSTNGAGTPGGSTGQVQYNNAGAFGGFGSWDGTTFGIGTLGYSDTGINAFFVSSTNSYNQVILQNTSNGAAASTNFNVSNNLGTSTTNFGEFGINSSGFTGTGSFSQAGYVYLAAASTDLVIGTYGNNGIHFVINSGTTDAAAINTSGYLQVGSSTGRIGINVSPSLGTLHILGASGLAPIYVRESGSTNGFQLESDGLTLRPNIDGNTTLGSSSFRFGGFFTFRGRVVGGEFGINISNTVVAHLQIGASTTTKAHICFEVGVAPTTPTDGQMWWESNTNTGLKIRIAGVTKTVSLV